MAPELQVVAEATAGTPFEGRLWLVGGAVRDELLGLGVENDFDIVTELDSAELADLLWGKGASSIPPVTYARFGTALVHVLNANIELVTARRESYQTDSRKPSVEPATLEEDAVRRDFTVNTLLRNVHTGELHDPLGTGLDDLRAKVLRTPRDPEQTFFDDPLRMLRAVRFRWKLGFEPAPGLYEAIGLEVHRLDVISAERIRDEFVKMLLHPSATSALRDLMTLGLLDRFAPEFRAMVGVDQGKWHHLDVWEHTLLVVDNLPWPWSITQALSALLHDVGKPPTQSIDEKGDIRFFGHEFVGAEMASAILRRLKFSNEEIAPVVLLVKNHMRMGSFTTLTTPAARRLVRDLGESLDDLLTLVEADAAGLKAGVRALDLSQVRDKLSQTKVETPTETLVSPLSGDEIMSATGLPGGPEIGRIKAALAEEVLEGRIAPGDRNAAREWLRHHGLPSTLRP